MHLKTRSEGIYHGNRTERRFSKNRFLQFLEEDNGGFSATRLGFLLWIVGALIVWVIVSLAERKIQNIPNDVAAIIGILMTGKVVQKFGEKPSDVKPPQ